MDVHHGNVGACVADIGQATLDPDALHFIDRDRHDGTALHLGFVYKDDTFDCMTAILAAQRDHGFHGVRERAGNAAHAAAFCCAARMFSCRRCSSCCL